MPVVDLAIPRSGGDGAPNRQDCFSEVLLSLKRLFIKLPDPVLSDRHSSVFDSPRQSETVCCRKNQYSCQCPFGARLSCCHLGCKYHHISMS